MKPLAERTFDRNLAQRIREEMLASPAALEIHHRHHPRRPLWQRIAIATAVSLGAVLTLFSGLILMPVSFFLPVWALIVPDSIREVPPEVNVGPELALAVHSLVITAIACFVLLLKPGAMFCLSEDVAVLSFYPVRDRELLNRAIRSWMLHLGYFLYVLLLAYAGIAWRFELTTSQIAWIAVLAILQTWHLMALATIVAYLIPTRLSASLTGIALGLTMFGASMLYVLAVTTSTSLPAWIELSAFLLPTGWINGAIYYSVINGENAGYLFLLPVALTTAYGIWWLRRGYAIREIRISSLGEVCPKFKYGLANTSSISKDVTPLAAEATLAADAPIEVLTERLKEHTALAPADWSQHGFLERWIGSMLTSRQRALLEHFYGGRLRWTAEWLGCIVLAVLLAAAMAAVEPQAVPAEPVRSLTILIVLVGPSFELCLYAARTADKSQNQMPMLHPIFPIGHSEMRSALWKANGLRAIACFPLVVLLAVAEGEGRADKWLYAGAVLAVSAASLWMTYALAARICFGSMHCYRFLWRRWLWIGLLSVALSVPFALIFYVHWAITLGLVGLMVVSTQAACHLFDHQYLQGEFDFRVPDPMRPNYQGREKRKW